MTHKTFAIISSHVTFVHLRFIKSTRFYRIKQSLEIPILPIYLLFIYTGKIPKKRQDQSIALL